MHLCQYVNFSAFCLECLSPFLEFLISFYYVKSYIYCCDISNNVSVYVKMLRIITLNSITETCFNFNPRHKLKLLKPQTSAHSFVHFQSSSFLLYLVTLLVVYRSNSESRFPQNRSNTCDHMTVKPQHFCKAVFFFLTAPRQQTIFKFMTLKKHLVLVVERTSLIWMKDQNRTKKTLNVSHVSTFVLYSNLRVIRFHHITQSF